MNIAIDSIALNATFFVQMANFWVAYWVLRILLFRPVYTEIKREDAELSDAKFVVEKAEKKLARSVLERTQVWSEGRVRCQKVFPGEYSKKDSVHDLAESLERPAVKDDDLERLRVQVSEQLLKRLGGVRV